MDVDTTPQSLTHYEPHESDNQRGSRQEQERLQSREAVASAWNTCVHQILCEITNWPLELGPQPSGVINAGLYQFLHAIFKQWPLENQVDINASAEEQQMQLESWFSHITNVIKKALYVFATKDKQQ